MSKQNNDPDESKLPGNEKKDPPGYPLYPPSEDIYSQSVEEVDIDPENPTALKTPNEGDMEGMSGNGLDIPGAELDDDREETGNEDEENNFYSLGDTK